MKKYLLLPIAALILCACAEESSGPAASQAPASSGDSEIARWEEQARNVTIIRDTWGIPHIYGKTDADAVFGMLYAQAEDDFNRVEMNYINALGRLAEIEGESEIYRDLRMKLYIRPDEMKQLYAESPEWLKELMDAYADGLNYYLHTHPEVTPRLIDRFEPWMALTFSEGSIGGDIERVEISDLQQFYGGQPVAQAAAEKVRAEPSGSNGFSIAPSSTLNGNALFYINPHTSFFFRAELQVVSEEGLNTYGATTWGQFFVYQGFNENTGWMHTSSEADSTDSYLETVIGKDGDMYYVHGDEYKPLRTSVITIPYKTADGMGSKDFTAYHSHHGPIVGEKDGRWVAFSIMERPVDAIRQSFLRTKANNLDEFRKTMDIRTNSSNNTVYADSDGNIALFFGNYIPRRDPSFDWNEPVDGSDPRTDYQGLHTVDEIITVLNPSVGWVQNTNNWPFSAAGPDSPKQADYPTYMAPDEENPRGVNAVRVLEGRTDFTLESLIEAGYDTHLSAFAKLIPSLLQAYDGLGDDNESKSALAEQIEVLRNWDYSWGVDSVATSLAVYWGQEFERQVREATGIAGYSIHDYMANETHPAQRLGALAMASRKLEDDFGDWRTPWGEINRYQRINGDIVQPFNDDEPSIPVGFTSANWGSLASFGASTYPGTKRMYGTSGPSFVAAVEFGDKIRAKAITAGGQSGDPESPHFGDQAQRYADGNLRDVWFYREDVEKNATRTYYPGE
jgi:acyl-homoserine-lactone acylase